jgi:DNA-binding NarL/FixJ family response regulator
MKRNRLTNLEKEALALVLQGKSNKQIAAELCEEETTVKARIRSAYRVLGIRYTRELLPIVGTTKELLHLVS